MCIWSNIFSSLRNSTESTVEQNISVVLNGEESELKFLISQKGSKVSVARTCLFAIETQFQYYRRFVRSQEEFEKADAFVLVYSVVDKASYTRVEQLLMQLQDADLIRSRPVIIVANKIDLARSRAVSSQGKTQSNTHRFQNGSRTW